MFDTCSDGLPDLADDLGLSNTLDGNMSTITSSSISRGIMQSRREVLTLRLTAVVVTSPSAARVVRFLSELTFANEWDARVAPVSVTLGIRVCFEIAFSSLFTLVRRGA